MPGTFQAGLTVVRMILEVIVHTVTVNQNVFGAFGVMVNTAVSAIDAILDLYDYYLHQNFYTTAVSPNALGASEVHRYDIRTARRVRGEQRTLDFVITNNAASVSSLNWSVSARMLLKGS